MSSRDTEGGTAGLGCCASATACVFAKALLAGSAACALATRRSVAEHTLVECSSPVARTNCGTLAALLHERARFALRLPPTLLVLLCHKRSLAFARRQHGQRGNVLSKAAAIRSRKLVMDDGT